MPQPASIPTTIDQYIAASPPAVRPVLEEIRRVIRAAAPEAEEVISYRMPAFRQRGILVFFAAFKNHIGLYPPVSGDEQLERDLKPHAGPKGNLKFPLDRPIPYALIRRIVKLRVQQELARAAKPSARKSRPAAKRAGGDAPRRTATKRRPGGKHATRRGSER